MQRIITPRLIPALLSIAFAGTASASGFQLFGEQNAAAIGNAGAGSAVVSENASVVYYNPAAMTQLPQYAISAGVSAVYTQFEFSNGGSTTGYFSNSGNGGNAGGWGFVPNMYGTMALTKDLYIGLGIGAPFGLKTAYDSPWVGSAQSNSFEIKTLNINPSIAWRATDWMSLGAGVNWQRIDATYKRNIATGTLPPLCSTPPCPASLAVLPASNVTLNLSDDAWGWNVGALFTLAPQTKLGVAYRSKVKYSTDGSSTVGSVSAAVVGGSSNVAADITLPDTFAISLSQGVGENWELLGDITWTGWSSIPKVDIVRTQNTSNGNPLTVAGTTAQVLDTDFRDAWRFAAGANYKLSDAVKLRFGLAYDQTPVPDAQHRLTSLPDNNRVWFSTGAQWKPAKDMALDFGVAYLYLKNADIDNNQSTVAPFPTATPTAAQSLANSSAASANRGTVKGTYDDACWLLGVQFSMNF